VVLALLLLARAFCATAFGEANQPSTSHFKEIDGIKLHYLTAGQGPALVLLHGDAETALMWKPIIPALAKRFTVIVPDLPGIGDSAIPTEGLEKLTLSTSGACMLDLW
jgi:pimeloyl-ACP methyl ester carboxylesterase